MNSNLIRRSKRIQNQNLKNVNSDDVTLENKMTKRENEIIASGDHYDQNLKKQHENSFELDKNGVTGLNEESVSDKVKTPIKTHSKYLIFLCLYIGYVGSVFCRKSFSFVLPFVVKDGTLSKSDLGLMSSLLNATYALSKFIGGIMVNQKNAKFLFVFSITLSGFFVILVTGFNDIHTICLIWLVHGLIQGICWPALANILKMWSRPAEFGTQWGIQCTSMNFACAIGPIIAVQISTSFNWVTSMHSFGIITLLLGWFCFAIITDSPAGLGFNDDHKRRIGLGRGTKLELLKSRFLWLMMSSYFTMYLVRTAIFDWSQIYLIEECGIDVPAASMFTSYFEIGGLIGTFASCFIADFLLNREKMSDNTIGSKRLDVCLFFVLGSIVSMCFLLFSSNEFIQDYSNTIGSTLGFFIYGPCSLYGVISVDTSPAHLISLGTALVSSSSSVGAVFAGLPISLIASYLNWHASFVLLLVGIVAVAGITQFSRSMKYSMLSSKKKV